MDGALPVLDPATQGDVLRRQLGIVRTARTGSRRSGELAALMVLWHASFYRPAFEAVEDECEDALDHCKGAREWNAPDLTLALELALGVHRYEYRSAGTLPARAQHGLWHPHERVRYWTRACLYWVTPNINAADLFDPCVMAWQCGRYDPELTALVALAPDGLEQLWNLRDLLPCGDELLDVAISLLATGDSSHNPFVENVLHLGWYMFTQSMRLADGMDDFWFETLRDAADPDALLDTIRSGGVLLDSSALTLAKSSIDLSSIEMFGRPSDQPYRIVRRPIWIERNWYRLIEYSNGELRVQLRSDGDYWSYTDDVSPGVFIMHLIGERGEGYGT